MPMKYAVISQDEPTGYIGSVTLTEIPLLCNVIRIDNDLYVIANIERSNQLLKLYVRKVTYIEEVKLDSQEYESEIMKQLLSTIMNFIKKHNIETEYFSGGIRLVYERFIPGSCNSHLELRAAGTDLSHAMLYLRSQMIDRGIIKRGEW